ncbi:hypothetical protein V2P20_09050 [Methylobacter sp. Wu1]|uniref:hypothetical protein n=1 Tax=Methylobacter sp. Wu1 TaxID=3119359 RepID=UPI002F9517CD
MTKYILGKHCIFDAEKNKVIPMDEGNRHYKEYLVWVSEGNEPDPMTDEMKILYE